MREFLLLNAEQDKDFRDSLRRASVLSLRAVGGIEVLLPLLMFVAGLSVLPIPLGDERAWLPNIGVVALGATSLVAAYTRFGRRYARALTALSVFASGVVVFWSASVIAERTLFIDYFLLGYLMLAMFAAAAAVPLKPLQTLALGLASMLLYAAGGSVRHSIFLLMAAFLSAALTAVVYRQRWKEHLAHQNALRTSEQLRAAENRLLIADNAAMMGRVAAALSHELNSPIGVLVSAVDSLAHVGRRMADASASERPRFERALEDLTRSGQESGTRLRNIVARMQRFTNLDRAEVQSMNVNDLLADAIALIASHRKDRDRIQTSFSDLPRIVCRPQQLSAVFSNLLSNALDAAGDAGTVTVATVPRESEIEIVFSDTGAGIPEEHLSAVFDPAAFRVANGRIAAGHWSLFSCRQITREHGGDIEVASSGTGTRVTVRLPHAEAAGTSSSPQ